MQAEASTHTFTRCKQRSPQPGLSPRALACRRKFLRFCRKGFHDAKYFDWERGYKEAAHEEGDRQLGKRELAGLIEEGFGFIARPDREIFLKPNVTRRAADAYGMAFNYTTRPGWPRYAELLRFAQRIAQDLADLEPRDLMTSSPSSGCRAAKNTSESKASPWTSALSAAP